MKKGLKGSSGQEKDALKVIVRRFALNGAQLNPSVTLIGEQDLAPVKVAPVILTGIGVKENGLLARDAVAQIMAPLLQSFTTAAGDAGLYQGMSAEALKEMGVGQLDQIKTQVQQEVDKIGEGLKKLFD